MNVTAAVVFFYLVTHNKRKVITMKLNYILCVHTETLRYLRNMDSCVFIAASIIIYNNKTNRKTQAVKLQSVQSGSRHFCE